MKSKNFIYDALKVCVAGKFRKLRMRKLAKAVENYRWTLKELKDFERRANAEMKEQGLLK